MKEIVTLHLVGHGNWAVFSDMSKIRNVDRALLMYKDYTKLRADAEASWTVEPY